MGWFRGGGGLLLRAVGAHEEELADHFLRDAHVAVAELAEGEEGQVADRVRTEGGWGEGERSGSDMAVDYLSLSDSDASNVCDVCIV